MQLKKITFEDFRCFRGKTSINLAPEKEKSIIVILGENTNGKSTIVQAFAWCFYGFANFDNPDIIYNRDIGRFMPSGANTTASVEVVFEHENITYIARRSQTFRKRDDGVLVSINMSFTLLCVDPKTGQTLPCGTLPNDFNRAINNILPSDLAQYFFFEGEKDHNLTTKSLGDAVKNLMGIQALSNMKSHLYGDSIKPSAKSVIGYYQGKLVRSDNERAKQEWQKRIQIEDELDQIEQRITELSSNITNYQERIEEINTILRDAAPTRELQQKRDRLKTDLIEENAQLDRAFTSYISMFNDKATDLLSIPILKKASEQLDKMDLSDKGIVGIEVSAIKELLKRGVCLCGTDLKEGTLAYKNVEKYIDILPPKSVGVLVRSLQDQMSENKESGMNYIESERDKYKDVQYSLRKIRDYEIEESDISEKLKNSKDVNVKQYEEELSQDKKRVRDFRGEIDQLNIKKGSLQNSLTTAINNYNDVTSQMKKNEDNELYLAYAEALFAWLEDTYNVKETEVREKLEIAVTELFNSIYSGNRKVIIDDRYNIKVIPAADTGSLKAIQYFSYVGGLVKVAKEIMKERQNDEIQYGEEYPLVLDAAFSHADEKHTKAIAVELSKVTNQLIFAVMNKDWAHVGKHIENRIAKTYELKKLSEDEVAIEEV